MEKKPQSQKTIQATAFVSTAIPEIPNEIKDKNAEKNIEYKPFGSDNLYPQALAALFRKSVTLRGIIKSKVQYIVGGGFTLNEENGKATDFVNMVNSRGQSLSQLFTPYLTDRFFSGNVWLEVITDPKKSFVNIEHVQVVKVRRHKNGEDAIIHPDWANYKKGDNLSKVLPLWPNFKRIDGANRSMVQVKDYEPDFDWYGIPDYIAAMDAAAIGYKTDKWNVSRLDNSFQTSGVLVVDGNMSDDDAADLKKDFKAEMTGEGNQGKVMLIVKKLGGEGTEYTPINQGSDGDWMQLHNQSNDSLIMACNWKKSLAGITESTGFDTDRILNDYQVLKSTVINNEQKKFIETVKNIVMVVRGLDLEGLTVLNTPPVSLLTKLTADSFTKKWEGRMLAGLDYDAEDPSQDQYIDSTTSKPISE